MHDASHSYIIATCLQLLNESHTADQILRVYLCSGITKQRKQMHLFAKRVREEAIERTDSH